MRVLITGAAGFLGQKLAKSLIESGQIDGQSITALELVDVVEPPAMQADFPVLSHAYSISDVEKVNTSFAHQPEYVFHLAAVVSRAAEVDLDLGLRVNLQGTFNLLESARFVGNCPVIIYASSGAVHGGEEPEVITDGVQLNPQTSYGTQKAIGELLLNDYSRRGLIDGRGLRLPTVTIRPGKANAAASSFMSSIFRDTMQGRKANCPVGKDFSLWHAAPRTVVSNLIIAAEIEAGEFGFNRNVDLPGRTDTIGNMIAAMTDVFGPKAEKRITWRKDEAIETIVNGWRARYEPHKAIRLGFAPTGSFTDSVKWFLEDDIVR